MTPRSDICPKCENHRANISTAAGQQEKQEHLQAFTEHLLMVEKERQVVKHFDNISTMFMYFSVICLCYCLTLLILSIVGV